MSVSWKKLKVGPNQLTPHEIVAYITEPQPSGDYYSESGQALMVWHVMERAAALLGIARPDERPLAAGGEAEDPRAADLRREPAHWGADPKGRPGRNLRGCPRPHGLASAEVCQRALGPWLEAAPLRAGGNGRHGR